MTDEQFNHYAETVKFDEPATHPTKMADMCELISREMVFTDKRTGVSKKLTAEEIFEYSPTGELSRIFDCAEIVYVELEQRRRVAAGESADAVREDITQRQRACLIKRLKDLGISGKSAEEAMDEIIQQQGE